MDPAIVVAFVGALGSVFAVFVANRFTSRSARAAQKQAAEIERTKVDALAYQRARESYDAALKAQELRIQQLQSEMAEDRGEYRAEIADCKSRIRELEDARRMDQLRIRTLVEYMRTLIQILRSHQIDYPLPPAEMDL